MSLSEWGQEPASNSWCALLHMSYSSPHTSHSKMFYFHQWSIRPHSSFLAIIVQNWLTPCIVSTKAPFSHMWLLRCNNRLLCVYFKPNMGLMCFALLFHQGSGIYLAWSWLGHPTILLFFPASPQLSIWSVCHKYPHWGYWQNFGTEQSWGHSPTASYWWPAPSVWEFSTVTNPTYCITYWQSSSS